MKAKMLMAVAVMILFLPFTAMTEDTGVKTGEANTPDTKAEIKAADADVKLEEVVVTATKTERKIEEVPASVTVITGEEIKQMNVRDLSDVLKEAAGVDVVRAGTTGVATVSLRGLEFTQTAFLIDGQPAEFITTGWGGRSTVQLVDPDNVEKIEIVRGSGSSLYGPSAMGGVINIITKKAPTERNQTRLFAGYDDLSTYSGGVNTGGTLDRFVYSLNFRYQNSDGYKSAPDPAFFPGYPGTMLHSLEKEDWMKKTLGGRLGYLLSDRSDIAMTFNYLEDNSNTFGRPNTKMDAWKSNYGIEYKNNLTDKDSLSVNLSYNDHHGKWDWDSYFYPFSTDTSKTSTSDEKARKYTAEVKNQWDMTPSNTLLIGAIYARDELDVESQTVGTPTLDSDRNGNVKNIGLYLQDEARPFNKRLNLTLGARYDAFDYDLKYDDNTTSPATHKDISPSFYTFNPRAAARYNLTESMDLRASVGTGFRAPDTYGLVGGGESAFFEMRANPDLDSEKSVSYDLGVDQKFPFGLKVSLTGYYIEVKDYIQTASRVESGVFIYQSKNIGKVETKGVELEAEQEFTKGLLGFLNYTYNESKAASELQAGTFGLPEKGKLLSDHPLHKATAGIIYSRPDSFKFRIDGRYSGDQYLSIDTKNESKNKIDGYFVANTKLTYYIPVGKDKIDLSAGVNNIFDKKFETRYKNVFEEPRVIFAQVGYTF